MIINITPETLCTLCAPHFTPEACEAIANYMDDIFTRDNVPSIGDITILFSEVSPEDVEEEDGKRVIEVLNNGNILIMN